MLTFLQDKTFKGFIKEGEICPAFVETSLKKTIETAMGYTETICNSEIQDDMCRTCHTTCHPIKLL